MTSPTPTTLRVDTRRPHAESDGDDRFVVLAAKRRPRLSWVTPLERNGQAQTGAEIRVSTEHDDPTDPDVAAIVATGPLDLSDPFLELPAALEPHTVHWWSVRTRDEQGDWSAWAEPVILETGPWTLADWTASWVAHPALTTLRLDVAIDRPVSRARLHFTAQGLVRAVVNGVAINAASSDPSRTDLSRALYRTYDVTSLLTVGGNVLDLALGAGEWERSGLDPRVLAELVVTLQDGGVLRFGTGQTMTVGTSEVSVEEPFYLERHVVDAARDETFHPSGALRTLAPSEEARGPESPPLMVRVDPAPPLHRVARMEIKELSRSDAVRVFDVGVNIAGVTRVVPRSILPIGTKVRVVHGEHLDRAGRLDTTNLTMPYDHGRTRQALEYEIGEPFPGETRTRVLEPWFCYHGFRYVEVTGLPAGAEVDVEAWTLHSDLEPVSELITDDVQVNALVAAARRTFLNNVHGIPEDCPTREKAGWTGDTASVTEFVFAAFNVQGFYAKWLGDLRTSQQSDGNIPAISPDIRPVRTLPDPVWGGAIQGVLLGHWFDYGDRRVVADNLRALRRWVDYLLTLRDDSGVISQSPISYGSDWLGLVQTPPPVHHTGATITAVLALALLEEAVGEEAGARVRRAQAEELRSAARAAFWDADRRVMANGTQGAYAIAIGSGILHPDEAVEAADRIAADFRERGDRPSSGFATTRRVVRALGMHGHSQVVFDALHQSAEPGIGAMLDHGSGTFWECWWIDPENTGTGSLNHVGLGGPFAGWAWHHLAGVSPTGPGWSTLVIEPTFVDGVDRLQMVSRTIRGNVAVSYEFVDDTLSFEITVPVGATATLRLPCETEETLGSGHHARRVAAGAVRRTVRSEVPIDERPWTPPSRPSLAADVVGESDWLARGLSDDAWSVREGSFEVRPTGIECMPVPHEQPAGPVLVLRADSDTPLGADGDNVTLLARLDPAPAVASDSTFLYASLDMCLAHPLRPLEALIRVHGQDGTVVDAATRFWPAGWTRVAVDVADMVARTSVVAVEVGVRVLPMVGEDPALPLVVAAWQEKLGFHLGEMGVSTVRRLW